MQFKVFCVGSVVLTLIVAFITYYAEGCKAQQAGKERERKNSK